MPSRKSQNPFRGGVRSVVPKLGRHAGGRIEIFRIEVGLEHRIESSGMLLHLLIHRFVRPYLGTVSRCDEHRNRA